jgi:hypothetical protein
MPKSAAADLGGASPESITTTLKMTLCPRVTARFVVMDSGLRLAMEVGSIMKMEGDCEADETFIGGLSKNMHKNRRRRMIKGTKGATKVAVMSMLQRKGKNTSSRALAS